MVNKQSALILCCRVCIIAPDHLDCSLSLYQVVEVWHSGSKLCAVLNREEKSLSLPVLLLIQTRIMFAVKGALLAYAQLTVH